MQKRDEHQASAVRHRFGVVSYLNSKPLIAGLELERSIEVRLEVPSELAGLLDCGDVDVALVPVIDLVQGDRNWRIVSDACIGCDGETLTVRVFSRVPPEQIHTLHVDGDSHTSVALAKVLWKQTHGIDLNIVPFSGRETVADCEAILLIGDKVVTQNLPDYEIETDLGSMWKSLTGLPFVFAVWATTIDDQADLARIGRVLSEARDRGVETAELIAEDFAPGMGWPVEVAKRYLARRLKFMLGDRQREGMERFFGYARESGLVAPDREPVFV